MTRTLRAVLLVIVSVVMCIQSSISFCPKILLSKRAANASPSLVFVGGINEETVPLEKNIGESRSATCPFSKAFPKYRIDLTTSSRTRKEESLFTKVPSFLSGVKQSLDKSALEQQCRKDTDRLEWIQDESGVAVLASLWRWAATMSSSQDVSTVVLGFPNSDVLVLRRWMDILDWLQEKSGLLTDQSPRIEATLLEKPTTAIRLTRIGPAFLSTNTRDVVDKSVIEKRMQAWVKRVLVDMSICPFTKSVTKSGQGLADVGVPVGRIAYHASDASPNQLLQLMADTWEAISDMMIAGPSGRNGVSSILLAAPRFDDDFDVWAGPVFAMLEASVVAADALNEIGVVCFHPHYKTPDGSSFPGFGHMHSVPRLQKWLQQQNVNLSKEQVAAGGAWQRRTPHATINVLRANQLEAAEAKRDSASMYTRNICKLVGDENDGAVGLTRLQQDLERERNMGQ